MNEEIMIDGVDVAGCSLYLKDNGKCLRLLTDNEPETECNAICDYGCLYHKEQLKRLEQERDELKFENDRYKQLLKGCPTEDEDCGLCVIDEQNKRLKQENKDLKKQIESDKGLITVGGKQQYDMTIAYDKCKTALEEIREIAEDIIENDVYENSDAKAEKILNKIDEILNKG